MIWHVLGGPAAGEGAGHDEVPPVSLYWHHRVVDPLDLAIRLQHRYLERCDYDWEHGAGIDLRTHGGNDWEMSVDLDTSEPLTRLDLAAACAMMEPDAPIRIEIQASRMIARAPLSHMVEMVARVVEWLEGDWREYVDDPRFFPSATGAI